MKRVAAVVALCLAAAACGGERVTDTDEVRAAIAATETVSRTVSYSDATAQSAVEVEATIEDDLRYQAQLSIDETPVYREVVRDDAISARVLDPRALEILAESPPVADVVSTGTDQGATEEPRDEPAPQTAGLSPDDRKVRRALLSGNWVTDRVGAPPLVGTGGDQRDVGDDPVTDALTVLDYVETTIATSAGVTEYDPDSLAYRPDEDPFPVPDLEAGVARFDLQRPPLPRTQDTDESGTRSPPSIEHFRKLSIYVKDGQVIKVLELVEVLTLLDDLATRFDVTVPPDVSGNEQAEAAMAQVNAIRVELGQEPIRVRAMEVEFAEHGADLQVQPPKKATAASLALLEGRGRIAPDGDGAPAATGDPGGQVQPPVVAPPGTGPAATPEPSG